MPKCIYTIFILTLLVGCRNQEKADSAKIHQQDSTTIKEEIAVINQSLRYLNPDEPKPTWDSPYRGVMSQGLEGEPVWVGFMSGVFMPPHAHFNERVERMEADWDKRFKGVDTAYRAVFRKLLDFWNPDFPPHLDSIPVDQLPQGGPDDVMWQYWTGFPASDTYNIYSFVTPAWLELHALSDEKILGFPYRKLGTLSISHVAFSQDKQLACFLYDMWGIPSIATASCLPGKSTGSGKPMAIIFSRLANVISINSLSGSSTADRVVLLIFHHLLPHHLRPDPNLN